MQIKNQKARNVLYTDRSINRTKYSGHVFLTFPKGVWRSTADNSAMVALKPFLSFIIIFFFCRNPAS